MEKSPTACSLAVAHNLKILLHILIITVLLMSCEDIENIERSNFISEFEDIEEYRVWTTEKSIDENGSVYNESRTFEAFDSKGRLINQGNFKFYYYQDTTNRITKTTYVFVRDGNVRIFTDQYDYDKNGFLQYVVRVGGNIDTIQSLRYDKNGNMIESKTKYRTVIQEFENGLLKKRIETEGNSRPRISEFEYDSLKRPIVENWVFSGDHRMKTRFEYSEDGKLISETDSSYTSGISPNTVIEFRQEYLYDKNDSISEIISLGRVRSRTNFYIRGRKTYERQLEKRN